MLEVSLPIRSGSWSKSGDINYTKIPKQSNVIEKKNENINYEEIQNQEDVSEKNSEKHENTDHEKVFENRQKIMKRGCKYLKHIEDLQNSLTTSFQELYDFHSFIHDINQPIEDKKETV